MDEGRSSTLKNLKQFSYLHKTCPFQKNKKLVIFNCSLYMFLNIIIVWKWDKVLPISYFRAPVMVENTGLKLRKMVLIEIGNPVEKTLIIPKQHKLLQLLFTVL